MGLNDRPASERVHIGFFGLRNAGKSSVVNRVTGQELSLVSDNKGTTTDPVKKTMELLPIGPVVIIDTPGIDDEGELGKMRVERAKDVLGETDIAVLVVDATSGLKGKDNELIASFKEKSIPYIIAYNKSDLIDETDKEVIRNSQLNDESFKDSKKNSQPFNEAFKNGERCKNGTDELANEIFVSALTDKGIYELKELIGKISKATLNKDKKILEGLVEKGDMVVLVVPIDSAAPKGRLILPQQMVIREILDTQAISIVTQVEQLEATLNSINQKPKLVITDSQAFNQVAKIVPESISLTSFSILLARYKGTLQDALEGASMLEKLKDGDKVLISEGCTHHRQCDDIGTVKLPNWILKYTGRKIDFQFTSGGEFPKDLLKYKLIIHCGGCMLNEKTMQSRLAQAKTQGIPMTNYGIIISHLNGILERCTEML